jgi:amidase
MFSGDADKECVDDPDVSEGMPTHVQVVGKPMMDEELLEIMKVVESVAKDAAA